MTHPPSSCLCGKHFSVEVIGNGTSDKPDQVQPGEKYQLKVTINDKIRLWAFRLPEVDDSSAGFDIIGLFHGGTTSSIQLLPNESAILPKDNEYFKAGTNRGNPERFIFVGVSAKYTPEQFSLDHALYAACKETALLWRCQWKDVTPVKSASKKGEDIIVEMIKLDRILH